jgi:NitT/TauT family transport system permease protein
MISEVATEGRLETPAMPSRPSGAIFRRATRSALQLGSVAACILLWDLAARRQLDLGVVRFENVPAPSLVLEAALRFAQSPKLLYHVENSLMRVFAGFGAASVMGIGIGLMVGRIRLAHDTIMPPLELLRPIPGVAWIPLAILIFPSSELSMIFITFMGALFPILLNTIHGVEGVERRLIVSSQCLGARGWQVFLEVVLPGALPSIVTGMSVGMGTSWFCLVTAEMIAGQYGIGYFTWESYNLQRYPEIVVGMLSIGVFGMLSSILVKRAGFALMPWYVLDQRGSK